MEKIKTTFYPMAGKLEDYFPNLLETLEWIRQNHPRAQQVHRWLETRFGLRDYFARDVHSVILISSGLVDPQGGRSCRLSPDGMAVLESQSSQVLLEIFVKSFAGLAVVLELLRNQPYLTADDLTSAWFQIVRERFGTMAAWSKRTVDNQLRHRLNWLRALGFVNIKSNRYALSESGWQFVSSYPPESFAIQPEEIKREENEIDKLLLGAFEPFGATKRVINLRRAYARDRAFRIKVSKQYDYYCAVCGFRLRAPRGVYEAEAAHIIPKQDSGTDDPRNGICLCATCHWAFDEGILTVMSADRKILIASYLRHLQDDPSAERYKRVHGKDVRDVRNPNHRPSSEALQWHNDKIFLG